MSDPHTHVAFLAPEIADLAPLFPGYEIETLIATGGMGAVYRAIQKSLDRTVAIKILPQEFSKDAAFCAGFEAEAKAMARLNHPNLIGVYDFGEVNGMLYIIMEFVPGKSVFDSAHGISIDPAEVIHLVTGICHGLSHAHENGILHRDIKPSNILLDLNGQPKIGDFGLARPIGTKVQDDEEIFGTPHYTAPEVVNSPQSVGSRADIFSVGVMLHELLTGRLPADDQRPASAIARCDPRFDAIIKRATNPLPELRYANASEIAKDLRTIAASIAPKTTTRFAGPKGPPSPKVPTNPKGPPRPIAVSGPGRRQTASASIRRKTESPLPGIIMLVIAIIIAYSGYKYYTKYIAQPQTLPAGTTANTPSKTPSVTNQDSTPKPKPLVIPKPREEKPQHTTPRANTRKESAGNTETTPDTTPTVSDEPKFDVPGFFVRARKIMLERANPIIAAHDENILRILDEYERGIKRLVRNLESGEPRDEAEILLEEHMKACREARNLIPKEIDKELSEIEDFQELHDEFLEEQETTETQFMESLGQLSSVYIVGLEKQIERLKTAKDPAAIELIEEEIDKTRNDSGHFPILMLGYDPTKKESTAEEKPKDE